MSDWLELTPSERDEVINGYKREGERTFLASGTIEECPHKKDSAFAKWWNMGFMNAKLGMMLAGNLK